MGAGGLIRDDQGKLKMAELLALYYGLQHCLELGLQQIEVELDSLLIVNWLENKRCGIWYLEDFWEEIIQMLSSLRHKVRHVYHECNVGPDFLERLASEHDSGTWMVLSIIPHRLKGILKVDKLGLPALHR
ncbi:uncharacterized protein LOC121249440 [Juglans microcarpa x Juglans regia]|uniref:uncharacterized protein LOC121249440 n=1 Tax=Juglans microcarpa x Juglans regia TaxID=2249226 RepID=UPI001B7E4EC7|nr:uncharacterized protein LOC121249440 [Juglans microcarpa x Juglans regia]